MKDWSSGAARVEVNGGVVGGCCGGAKAVKTVVNCRRCFWSTGATATVDTSRHLKEKKC
ncbi:hypothetical protein Hdeb2414_s0032g00713391 [Helianthus debilis subsp. tardiflorus]